MIKNMEIMKISKKFLQSSELTKMNI